MLRAVTPILRIFDEAKAREFYVDFPGFQVGDIDAYHAELASKQYGYARPDIGDTPRGSRDMSVKDPFGNRLTFTNAIGT